MVFSIIVTCNASLWIEECVSSILYSDEIKRIIIIDNYSTDSTVSLINTLEAKSKKKIQLVKLNKNFGFGIANNFGIRMALDAGASHVFLLNQDAKVHPDMMKELLNVSKLHPHFGVLSPIHLNYSGIKLDPSFQSYAQKYAPAFFSDAFLGKLKQAYETKFLPAALWLVKSDVFKTVGYFDPVFFMYGEDDDLAARVLQGGWSICFVPSAIGYHFHGEGSKQEFNEKRFIGSRFTRNLIEIKDPSRSVARNFLKVLQNTTADFAFQLLNRQWINAKCVLYAFFLAASKIPYLYRSRIASSQIENSLFCIERVRKHIY
jgi:GT2 family glycosyltransferase